jgi:tetratricopeptide (TPR) repeat protein
MLEPRAAALGAAVLLVALFVAYSPALRGGFIWDDDAHITENMTLRDAAGLSRIWLEPRSLPQYYPMVHTTFWLEYQAWGLDTLGYHVTNVVLHAAGALLLGCVAAALALPGAPLAAALFALHPVHVESVAWITERKNVLSGVFYLAALLCYLRFRPLEGKDPGRRTTNRAGKDAPGNARRGYYLLACAFFACALMSKTVTCTLPAAILVLVWWKRGRVTRADVVPLLPLFAAGIASGLVTAWLERKHVGAEGAEWALGAAERCLIAGRALWFDLSKLAWPADLAFVYPRWRVDARVLWQYCFPLGAAAAAALLWLRRDRLGRGPLAATLFFAGTLFPALGFFNIYPMRYSFVADHFQYLASAGPIVLAAAGYSTLARRLGVAGRPVERLAALAVLALLGTVTFRQAHIYRDLRVLWRDTLRKYPEAWMAHVNLGTVYTREREFDQAIAAYREAIRLNPGEPSAYYDLGNALVRQGKLEEALSYYRDAVHRRPWFVEAHYNLGLALFQLKRFDEAIAPLESAVRLDPRSAKMHHLLGQSLAGVHRVPEAIAEYRAAVAADRGFAPALNDLAWHLATQPDASARNGAEAVRLAERAVASGGAARDPNYLDTLAASYAEVGRFDDAVRTAREAISLAEAAGQPALTAEFQKRLEQYLAGRPHRGI